MDPEERIIAMQMSDDQERLLVFTVRDGMCVLTAYDARTMEVCQKLEIMPGGDDLSIENVIRGDHLLVPVFFNEESLVVITESEYGIYELEFVSELVTEDIRQDIFGGYWLDTGRITADYDGERLALVYPWPLHSYFGSTGRTRKGQDSFLVFVFEQDGMAYCGEYMMSQGIGEVGIQHSCHIRTDVRMGAEWEE